MSADLEEPLVNIAEALKSVVKEIFPGRDLGFFILLFDKEEEAFTAFVSTCNAQQTRELLSECVSKLPTKTVDTFH